MTWQKRCPQPISLRCAGKLRSRTGALGLCLCRAHQLHLTFLPASGMHLLRDAASKPTHTWPIQQVRILGLQAAESASTDMCTWIFMCAKGACGLGSYNQSVCCRSLLSG